MTDNTQTADQDITASETAELESSVRELHITAKPPILPDITRPISTAAASSIAKTNTNRRKTGPAPVADSWEDELDSSEAEAEDQEEAGPARNRGDITPTRPLSPLTGAEGEGEGEGPLDPPPTPNSPPTSDLWSTRGTLPVAQALGQGYAYDNTSVRVNARGSSPSRRPEKQTAVAGRLIAGALGIRAPKRTEEQRAYDRAVKEQEARRRNREREEAAKKREEEERVKAAVWTD